MMYINIKIEEKFDQHFTETIKLNVILDKGDKNSLKDLKIRLYVLNLVENEIKI